MLGDLWRAYQKRSYDKAIEANVREVRTFVSQLEAMDEENLGLIVAATTVMRIKLEDHGYLPRELFFDSHMPAPEKLGRYQLDLDKLTRDFKRLRQHTDAVAAVILALSLRSLYTPEIRPLGRDMWGELMRGFDQVEEKMKLAQEHNEEPFPERAWTEWNRVPAGLQPLKE